MRGSVRDAGRRGHEGDPGARHLSPLLLAWLDGMPLERQAVLDLGTGAGALALHVAPRARRVIGIDTDAGVLVDAARRARLAGLANVAFVVADAERADYRALARPQTVVAHLCMSDAMIARAAAGVDAGGVLAFAAFHTDQWRETGRVSRFAYSAERAREVMEAAGFRVERLEVETSVGRYATEARAIEATTELRGRWEADGRWAAWEAFLARGGRTLTQSRVVALGRRVGGTPA